MIAGLPDWIITALSGFGGWAAGWGYLKARVRTLESDNKDNKAKIEKLEARGLQLLFKTDCTDLRTHCQLSIKGTLDEIKEEIVSNREHSTEQFQKISTFMGYVQRALDNGKAK